MTRGLAAQSTVSQDSPSKKRVLFSACKLSMPVLLLWGRSARDAAERPGGNICRRALSSKNRPVSVTAPTSTIQLASRAGQP
jgi:hypothetical protein